MAFPAWSQRASRLVSLPPGVRRRASEPSGRMRQTCWFMPPPGATCTASQSPAGDHSTDETGSSKVVTSSGHPPPVDTVQTWGEPVTLERNATRLPSGDRLGAVAVSYTHLRAHETPEHLVCRLLLEK